MGFNYGREKRAFDEKWARLEVEYRAAGMSEKAIQDMKNYDWQWFCSERTYRNHVQTLPVGDAESHGEKMSRFTINCALSLIKTWNC